MRLLVRDLMKVGVATCPPHTPLRDIARLLLEADLEGVIVLDTEGHGTGVVTQDELIKAYARQGWETLTAEDIMRPDVPELPADIPLTAAAQLMQDMRVRVVFLMHHSEGISYPAAALSYKHFLRLLAATDDTELHDLGYGATRRKPLDAFIEKRDAAKHKSHFQE